MTSFAQQFEDLADCCLGLARSAETLARRERLIQMADEYRLATTLLIQDVSDLAKRSDGWREPAGPFVLAAWQAPGPSA
jgi:hypothetical protein